VKFTEAIAHLAVALRDPLAEYMDLARQVREGSERGTLDATERKLVRMAADEGYPFDWGGGTFKHLFRGKPGRGGGFEATPTVLAFFLTAYLLDCPRREAAARALDMTFAAAHGRKGGAICAKTKQRYFGAAFVTLLSDRALFDQADEVCVCADLGVAQLVFEDSTTSSFFTAAYDKTKAGTHSVRHLYADLIRPLFDLINNEPEPPPRTPARGYLLAAEE
jgi:hypothetical protein